MANGLIFNDKAPSDVVDARLSLLQPRRDRDKKTTEREEFGRFMDPTAPTADDIPVSPKRVRGYAARRSTIRWLLSRTRSRYFNFNVFGVSRSVWD